MISVAAANYQTPTVPEIFSNHGPRTLLFEPVDGTVPAAALSSPELVAAPSVMSVDGVHTTFLGKPSPDGGWVFSGTSAAAPNAAAVVALGRQLRPDADPDELTLALLDSATPVESPWPAVPAEYVAGAGLVDATGFLEGLLQVPTAPLNVQAIAGREPGTATVSFAAPALTGTSPILSYTVSCDGGGITSTPMTITDSPATVTGLAPGVTTCSVTAVNAQGPGAAAMSAPFDVTAAPATTTPVTTAPESDGTGNDGTRNDNHRDYRGPAELYRHHHRPHPVREQTGTDRGTRRHRDPRGNAHGGGIPPADARHRTADSCPAPRPQQRLISHPVHTHGVATREGHRLSG